MSNHLLQQTDKMLKDQGDRYNGALSRHTSEQSAWQTVSQWGYHRLRPSPLQLSDTGWVTANLPQCHLLISLGLCCCNPHMYCCVYWQREREKKRESITMKAITLGSEVINTVFSNPPFLNVLLLQVLAAGIYPTQSCVRAHVVTQQLHFPWSWIFLLLQVSR